MADLYCSLYGKVYVPLALVGRFMTSCTAQNDYQDLTLCMVAKITFAVLDFVCNHDHSNCAIITDLILVIVSMMTCIL